MYLSAGLGFPKREVYGATRAYAALTDELRSCVPARVFDLIVHTDNRAKVRRLEAWVRATETLRLPLGILWGNRGAPPRGPPETAGCFRPFPFLGACRAGLQLAGLIAHPSRNENGHAMTIAPFAARVIAVLQGKYDQGGGKVFGKKML